MNFLKRISLQSQSDEQSTHRNQLLIYPTLKQKQEHLPHEDESQVRKMLWTMGRHDTMIEMSDARYPIG